MLNQISVDRDPRISITDGRVMNEYQFHDINNYPDLSHNYPDLSPCAAVSSLGTGKILPAGPVPDHFTIPLPTSGEVWGLLHSSE